MIDALFYLILLLLTVVLEVSLISALPAPFAWMPLFFVVGVIIFHRGSVEKGAVWFLAGWILFQFLGFPTAYIWSYIAVILTATPLLKKLFASRSIYALFGFGISSFFVFFAVEISIMFTRVSGNALLMEVFWKKMSAGLLFLLVGLYFGFFVAKVLEYAANHVFLIKRS